MQPRNFYTAGEVVMVRASSRPRRSLPEIPATSEHDTPSSRDRAVRFLREVMADPILPEAIELASPALSAELSKIPAGVRDDPATPWAELSRVVLSVARYVARIRCRATPFGLMAGVALAGVGNRAELRVGDRHRRSVRPDGRWLTGLIRRWEQDPQSLAEVRVWLHPSCRRRGDRLILPDVEAYHRDSGTDGDGHEEGSVRHTVLVDRLAELSAAPIPLGQLVEQLRRAFPELPAAGLWPVTATLLASGFLVSELWTAPQEPDPAATLRALRPAAAGEVEPPAAALAVDLLLDVDLRIPRHLLRHVESAVTAVQRVTPPRSRMTEIVDYQREFAERYGLGHAVPVTEVIDPDRGIGVPAGFRRPPSGRAFRQPPPYPPKMLAGLAEAAHSALLTGGELELTDQLIELLDGGGGEPIWPSADVAVTVHSPGLDAVDRGEYQLALVPDGYAHQAGRMFGRFLSGLDGSGRMRDLIREHEPDGCPELVQLRYRPSQARHFHLAHAPQLTRRCLWLDGPKRPGPGFLSLDDVGLYATETGLHAVDLTDGRELRFVSPHMLNPELAPNLARLLDRLEELNSRPLRLWSWRSLEMWPRLPRVRHGRTVVYPASWRAPQLAGQAGARGTDWDSDLFRWRSRMGVPDGVVVAHHGQRLALDLTEPGDRLLLRRQLAKEPESLLFEDLRHTLGPAEWLDGREHELVVPLFAVPAARRPARPRIRVRRGRPQVHLPGEEWLYLRLQVSESAMGAFLSGALSRLVHGRLAGRRWFFIRYTVPSDHLRLRIHTESGHDRHDLMTAVSAWARTEWDNGGIGGFELAGYEPETWRYGDGEAMRCAETVFWRDSQAVLAQLGDRTARRLGVCGPELAALNYLHLLDSFGLPGWRERIRDQVSRERPGGITAGRRRRLRDLAEGSHWPELTARWAERAQATAEYGRQLALQSPGDHGAAMTAVTSLLHMHFNRLCGVDELKERQSLSLLRELVVSQLSRR